MSPKHLVEHAARYSPSPDLLGIGRVGSIGGVVRLPETDQEYLVSATLAVLQPTSISPDFLFYALQSRGFQQSLGRQSTGSTRQSVGIQRLRELRLFVPPLDEQRRIAAKLDAALEEINYLKRNRQAKIEAFEAVRASMLNDLIQPKREPAVGREWSTLRLDAIGTVSTGPFGSLLHASDYVTDEIPLVNPINIEGSEIVPTSRKSVTEETAARLGAYQLRMNDIVVARRGELGRCAVVSSREDGWLCGTGCFFIRPNLGVDSNFIANFLRSDTTRQVLDSSATGATMPNLSNKTLASLKMQLPSIDEQRRIVSTLDEAAAAADAGQAAASKELELADAVASSMMTGLTTAR